MCRCVHWAWVDSAAHTAVIHVSTSELIKSLLSLSVQQLWNDLYSLRYDWQVFFVSSDQTHLGKGKLYFLTSDLRLYSLYRSFRFICMMCVCRFSAFLRFVQRGSRNEISWGFSWSFPLSPPLFLTHSVYLYRSFSLFSFPSLSVIRDGLGAQVAWLVLSLGNLSQMLAWSPGGLIRCESQSCHTQHRFSCLIWILCRISLAFNWGFT